ncbi:ATP-binding protein [Snodgrassella gandavensis]|uniref:ATP-binding protein n=1 Tax=Snodgrassella gandavensis TaxID=2946698 RepID=UPI001EF64D5F|nr:ATP-binding protein [Snodgrassella gandavensis]
MTTSVTNETIDLMKTNIKRMLSHFYKNVTVNDVLKEAVMNCIQANATEIGIDLQYEYHTNIDSSNSNLGNLSKIIITDNGEGLTTKNINAFFELATENKKNIGGKGIGRFSFLKIADRVSIDSISNEGEHVSFDFSYNASQENVIRTKSSKKDTYTKIFFSNLNLKHPKTQAQSCVNFLKEKFNLMLFLKQKETQKTINIRVFVNGKPFGEIISSFNIHCLAQANLKMNDCKFTVYTFLDYKKTGIEIFYCANNLTVKSFSFSGNFNKQYIFAITSDYFDQKSNLERTQFNFGSEDELDQFDMLSPKPGKNFEEMLKNYCFNIVREHEPELLKENKARLDNLSALYGYIDFSNVQLDNISFDEASILKAYRDKINQEEDNLINLLANKNATLDEIAEKVSEQNKHELAKYIFHRNLIVKRGLELKSLYENENILHELFFPQKLSVNCDHEVNKPHLYHNNIWLLDDKFMTYAYIASDVTIKRIIEEIDGVHSSCQSVKRPDLFLLYNKPEESTEYKDVVLIELKKGNIDYTEQFKAIDQVARYKRATEKVLQNINSFYCYVICDFDGNDENIESAMKDRHFTKVFSNKGCIYYGYLDGSKVHLIFVSLSSIFSDAEARNETFLKILKGECD